MPRETNPRELSDMAVTILIKEDKCPMCLGELDTGWECNDCGYDAQPLVKAKRERDEAIWEAREG